MIFDCDKDSTVNEFIDDGDIKYAAKSGEVWGWPRRQYTLSGAIDCNSIMAKSAIGDSESESLNKIISFPLATFSKSSWVCLKWTHIWMRQQILKHNSYVDKGSKVGQWDFSQKEVKLEFFDTLATKSAMSLIIKGISLLIASLAWPTSVAAAWGGKNLSVG